MGTFNMKYLTILLFTLLHYGSTKSRYGVTRRVHGRYKITRDRPVTKRCKINKIHAHLSKVIGNNKLCTGGADQPGNKRDEILPSRFDESKEFGRLQMSNAARRSGLFRNNGESMLPYPPLLNNPLSANAFRYREDNEDDGPPDDLDEREEESRRFPPDIRQSDLRQAAAMRSPNNFSPFPFMNPRARESIREQFERTPPNFASPTYPTPINPFNTATESRTRMPNGNYPGGEQLDNALERYMYGLTVARTPHKSSLNIPGEFARSQPDISSLPNSGLLFPPYNGALPIRDQTVVSNMDMAPQGEMQVAPRPLGAPFFMSQGNSELMAQRDGDLTGGLFRRGDMVGPNSNNMAPNYVKTGAPPLRNPMMRTRRKEVTEEAPDVTAMNSIFNDIESDEKEYKENVGTNLAAQRKDVVQRRNYNPRGYLRPNYRAPLFDDNIDTGNPEQNYLERKYEMVLNTIANTDNFIRDKENSETPDQNLLVPIGSTSMGNLRNEGLFNERTPFNRYGRNNFDLRDMVDGYRMLPEN